MAAIDRRGVYPARAAQFSPDLRLKLEGSARYLERHIAEGVLGIIRKTIGAHPAFH